MYLISILFTSKGGRGWVSKFATGLIYQIGHSSKSTYMSDQAVILPKWFGGIILPKGQLEHLYSFWTIPNLIY